MARTEHVRFLVMVPNYWGIGDTVDDAVEELLAAGGHIEDGFGVWEFPETTIFQSVHPVWGEITFTNVTEDEAPIGPDHRRVEAASALTNRRAAITRALVNDVVDADIREDLRAERDDIISALREMESNA